MPTVVLAMLGILLVAVLIIAIVLVGMHGAGRKSAPDLADVMARAARQLNGDGQPPRGMLMLFREMDEVSASDLNPRQLTGKIRSSIASARSAASATSPVPPPAPEGVSAPAVTADTAPEATDPEQIPVELSGDQADLTDPYGLATSNVDAMIGSAPGAMGEDVVLVDLPRVPSRS